MGENPKEKRYTSPSCFLLATKERRDAPKKGKVAFRFAPFLLLIGEGERKRRKKERGSSKKKKKKEERA